MSKYSKKVHVNIRPVMSGFWV